MRSGRTSHRALKPAQGLERGRDGGKENVREGFRGPDLEILGTGSWTEEAGFRPWIASTNIHVPVRRELVWI